MTSITYLSVTESISNETLNLLDFVACRFASNLVSCQGAWAEVMFAFKPSGSQLDQLSVTLGKAHIPENMPSGKNSDRPASKLLQRKRQALSQQMQQQATERPHTSLLAAIEEIPEPLQLNVMQKALLMCDYWPLGSAYSALFAQ